MGSGVVWSGSWVAERLEVELVDASDVQIGGASGATIQLSRALVGGEKITIIASLPGCTAGVGFQIQVFDLP